ncbi:biotin synthase BioB [Kiritimatiella glycovorans]|uniref:Biotin synthase n=1 Tax=Kiritimatiella glycovorans TaxID=1307763 RepID=A0A0G3ECW5_9BACT|nr:biotin synthase BioB [Kiritimatiella glycovorans]AKJ64301.1 Biotin synthase [Kiritimatiella glycovorans]
MNTRDLRDMEKALLNGESVRDGDLYELSAADGRLADSMIAVAGRLREHTFAGGVHLCMIANAKSGRCTENCAFCAQAGGADTGIETWALRDPEWMVRAARQTEPPVHRFSIVTSGRGPSPEELDTITGSFRAMPQDGGVAYCASLGLLDEARLRRLRDAGVSRYHHNLETARSFFPKICTSHQFEERTATIRAARAAGMSVCAGGLFGLGESDRQVVELALELRALEVDSVPVNFLTPVPGTLLEGLRELTPQRCLKIIALLRLALPDREILVCGGREANLGEAQERIFEAGASGIMTGNYLTTEGRALDQDLAMIRRLGLHPRGDG